MPCMMVIPPGLNFSSVIVPDAGETLDGEHDLTMAVATIATGTTLISLILLESSLIIFITCSAIVVTSRPHNSREVTYKTQALAESSFATGALKRVAILRETIYVNLISGEKM